MNGRKRHFLVDTNGWLIRVAVEPANLSDQEGARRLLAAPDDRLRNLERILVDQGYQSSELAAWVRASLGAKLVVTGGTPAGFWLAPNEKPPPAAHADDGGRWIVERSIAWNGRCRRLCKDYEYLPESEEAFCYLAMAFLLVRRLTR